jgi:hypothetical protein
MVAIHELKRGQVYTFCEKMSPLHNEECYRGRFLETREIGKEPGKIYKYIYIIRDLQLGVRPAVTISQLDWIVRVETLDDMLKGKTLLNPDVLGVIDEHL